MIFFEAEKPPVGRHPLCWSLGVLCGASVYCGVGSAFAHFTMLSKPEVSIAFSSNHPLKISGASLWER